MSASLFRALAVTFAIAGSLTGCFAPPLDTAGHPRRADTHVRGLGLAHIHEQVSGYFVKDAKPPFDKHNGAWIRCKGLFSKFEYRSNPVELWSVTVYGAPGVKTAADLRHPAYRLGSILRDQRFESSSFDTRWMYGKDWASHTDYTLLEVYLLRVSTHQLVTVERVRKFSEIKDHSYLVKADLQRQDGSTTATVTCGGSFFGNQSLAMYDLHVAFDTISAADTPQQIQVSAGPSAESAVLLFDAAVQLPDPLPYSYTWTNRHHIQGAYGGENEMYVKVAISYLDASHAQQVDLLMFSDLDNHQASQLPAH